MYLNDLKESIRCTPGNDLRRGVTFSITEVESFWRSGALDVCSKYESVQTDCLKNTVINDIDTCLRLSFYNKFLLDQQTAFYGFLSYDAIARNTLYGYC